MTINFALSLSFEGIELLHRVKRGWKQVGTVSVEDDNLDEALAGLRTKALKIAPDGLATKLIIPMDQIKYLALDTTQTNLDDIHAALDGATPYDLNELVIDYERSGGRTHIAAVARETLQEAQAFASAHKFNPVAFVAVPEPFTFQKEVFFGPTSEAVQILGVHVAVERDHLPVMKVGTRVKSRLLILDPLPDAIAEDSAPALPMQAPAVAFVTETDVPPPADPPLIEEAPAAAVVIDRIIPEYAPPQVAPIVATPAVPAPIAPAHVLWVDRIVAEHHPKPFAVAVTAPVVETRPVLARNPVCADISGMDRVIPEFRPNLPAAPKPVLTAVAPEISAAATGAVLTATKPQRAAQPRKKAPIVGLGLAASVAAVAVFAWSQWGGAHLAEPATPATVTVTAQAPAAATPPADTAPIIPALNIMRMAPPAAGPANVVVPAQQPTAGNRTTPIRVAAAQAGVPPLLEFGPAPQDTSPPAPVATAPRGQVLSPAEAQAAYEATGVWQRAPRLFDTPRIATQAALAPPALLPAPQRAAQPARLSVNGIAPDLSFIAPANPPAPDVVFNIDENGHIVPTTEGTPTPEGAIVYAGLPELPMRVRPALTEEQLARMAVFADVPDGVVVILGSPEIVPPTRPDDLVKPQEAPDETAQNPTATAGAVDLDGLEADNADIAALAPPEDTPRPRARPDDLVPAAPTQDPDTPDITSILEGIVAEDGGAPFIDMTAQAVGTSLRPTTRPRNFATVVAAARERQAAQPPAAAPAAAAPVAPQNYAPVPGGVAVAATQEGVIRLRELNLIGIYGRPNAPRALVRLSNGRYAHVEVGSSLDGGQVTAIGNGVLNYVKRGRTIVLEVPGG